MTAISNILAHVDIRILSEYGTKIKHLYLRSDFRYTIIYTSSICINALHDLHLIKMSVPRFVGTGNFLEILLCKMSSIQKVPQIYFKIILFF